MTAIRSILAALARGSAAYWNSHNTTGQIWLGMGLIALIVDAALCYQYGVTQTTWHGIGFAVVAFFFAKLPDGAYAEFEKGNRLAGLVLGLLCIPLGAVAYQSHIGYGAGVRMGDIKQAAIQDIKYEDARGQVVDNVANVKMWKEQLEKLKAANGWSPTTKADALHSELATIRSRIDEEKKGTRGRKAGCGKECERLQNEAGDIEKKIATVESVSDLTSKIEATQRLVDKYREASAKTESGTSSVAMQATANTQMFGIIRAAWKGEPLEQALKATEDSAKLANLLITAAGSLAFMLMAPIGFFMAGRNRRDDDTPPVRSAEPTEKSAPNGRAMIIERLVDDTTFADMLARLPGRRATA